MERTLISWNVPNIITIWLMLAIGFLLFGVVTNFASGMMQGKGVAASLTGGDDEDGGDY